MLGRVSCVRVHSVARFLFILLGWIITALAAPAFASSIRFSEVAAEDRSRVADEDGDYSGWVELVNEGPEAVDLAGWGLSADPEAPFQWTFPHVLMQPAEHLLVFTSGKNRRTPPAAAGLALADRGTQTPLAIPGLLLWLDASDVSSLDLIGDQVVRWSDKSGRTLETPNGPVHFDAVATEESHRPLFVRDPATHQYAVRFDGERQVLVFPEVDAIRSVFWVLQEPKTASDSFRPLLGHDTDTTLVRNFDRLLFVHSQATWLDGLPVDPRLTRLPNGRVSLQVLLGTPAKANSLAQSLRLPDLRWAGDMMEVLVYNRVVTEEERLSIQDYLHRKWLLPAQCLHTGFQPTAEQALYLTQPGGTPADVAPPVLAGDGISRGRVDDSNRWHWFATPTPGQPNFGTPSASGVAPAPTFAPPAGLFNESVRVQLLGPSLAGATIYYSTDGSEPLTQKYTGPIDVTASQTLRARVEAPGFVSSPIVTASYLQTPPGGLAVLALTTPPTNLWDETYGIYTAGPTNSEFYPNWAREWERPVHIEWYEPDGTPGFAVDAGMKIHGAHSRSYPQRSIRVHFRSQHGPSKLDYPVFPGSSVQKFDSLVLRNFGNDWNIACMRDAVNHALGSEMGLDSQAWRPAHVFLNGAYHGVVEVRERLDADTLAAHNDADPDNLDIIRNTSEVVAGDVYAYNTLNLAVWGLNATNDVDFAKTTATIDLPNFTDWLILELYADNSDWPQNNITVWRKREPAAKWRWALNDLDSTFNGWGFGADSNTVQRVLIDTPMSPFHISPIDFIHQLPINRGFQTNFLNRFADLLNTTLSASNVLAHIERIHNTLAPAMPAQIARWGSESNGLVPLSSLDVWETNVTVLRDFAHQRPAFVREHLLFPFELTGIAPVSIAWPDPASIARVQLNTLELPVAAGQWTGLYFSNIAVTVTVTPAPGWELTGWEGRTETTPSLQVFPGDSGTLIPVLAPSDPAGVHRLAISAYAFDAWSPTAPAGTYPPSMTFQQTTNKDPDLDIVLEGVWTNRYDRDSRSRLVGLGDAGISFLNTSDPAPGGGYLGAALLSLDTRGQQNIRVSWTGITRDPNNRPYALRLQWRPGSSGVFQDITDPVTHEPVEYVRNAVKLHSQRFNAIPLPPESWDQPLVQLRWKYYAVSSGVSGSRAELGLDGIAVDSEPLQPSTAALALHGSMEAPVLRAEVSGGARVTLYTSTDLLHWTPLESRTTQQPGTVEFRPDCEAAPCRFFQLKVD